MNDIPFKPEPGSPTARVLDLMARNPEDGYSNSDLALKFQVKSAAWPPLLAKPKAMGLVAYTAQGEDEPKVWCAGPNLAAWMAASNGTEISTVAATAQTRSKRGGKMAQLPALDISSLQVDVGLPVPEAGKGCSKWLNLLSLLKEPGHSVPLPKEYRGALYAFIKKAKAASDLQGTYIVRPDAKDATKCRVHRTA